MADLIDRQKAMAEAFTIMIEGEPFEIVQMETLWSLPSEQQWISVKDRLPEEEKRTYWVCTDYDHQLACRWTNINEFWPTLTREWHWNPFDIPHYARVVAWMPLPEPYREEDDG